MEIKCRLMRDWQYRHAGTELLLTPGQVDIMKRRGLIEVIDDLPSDNSDRNGNGSLTRRDQETRSNRRK
jgi:hypothetical protein